MGTLPANPTRSGHTFAGWFTTSAASGGTQVTANTVVNSNVTFWARWTALPIVTVTFNLNGGTSAQPQPIRIPRGYPLDRLPGVPTRPGHTFRGWFRRGAGMNSVAQPLSIEGHNGDTSQPLGVEGLNANLPLAVGDRILADTDADAYWLSQNTVRVTFEPNGGNVSPRTIDVVDGSRINVLPEPTRDRHIFMGWRRGSEIVTPNTIILGPTTLVATWQQINTIDRMMQNLLSNTSLGLLPLRRNTMVTIGRDLLAHNHEPAFVAGMLANVMGEGDFGQFEVAGSQTYLQYVITHHNYITRFSGSHIYNINDRPQDVLNIINNRIASQGDNVNIFGLGALQWTNGSRIRHLVENYVSMSGGHTITRPQVIEAELLTLRQQLSGEGRHTGPHPITNAWGFNLPNLWKESNSGNLNSEAAARNAGETITTRFVRPGSIETAARNRGNNAVEIFRVMMQ